MLPMIMGISVLKSLSPFFRKHVMSTISNWEFLFLNSTLIAIVSFVYAYVHKRENITNLFNLSGSQYACAGVVVLITVFTSVAVFKLHENGQIVMTSFLLKAVSAIVLVGFGIMVFNEELSAKQLAGILCMMLGMALLHK
jgi:drug/metabolite transporter (DMT)-like permease